MKICGVEFTWFEIIQMIGSLGTAAAFFITFFTLLEMRRQTRLQNNPIVKLRYRTSQEIDEDYFEEYKIYDVLFPKIGDKWKSHTTSMFGNNIDLKEKILYIEVKNSGKSEISTLSFATHLHVEVLSNPDPAIKGKNNSDNNVDFSEYIDLEPGDCCYIPVCDISHFPKYKLLINDLKYYGDSKIRVLKNINGDREHSDINRKLDPQYKSMAERKEVLAKLLKSVNSTKEIDD